MKKNVFVIALFLMFWQQLSLADLTIEISSSSDNALPLAIIPFDYAVGTKQPKTDVAKVIAADLFSSGKFKVLPNVRLPSLPSSLGDVDFTEWRDLDVDNMLLGEISMSKKGLYNIKLTFIDLLRKKEVISKRWENIYENNLRQVAHKMSDQIYQEITGVRGSFNTKIAYVTVKKVSGKKKYSLDIADSDGFNSQPLLRSNKPIMSPSWSPDGKNMAYVSFERGRSEIIVQSLNGKMRKVVASYEGINGSPSWSPDSKKISVTLSKSGSADVYILTLATKKLRRLTYNFAIETESVWAPDGNSLFFNSDRRGKPQIFQVQLGTGAIKRITFEGAYNSNPAISPDGNFLAMVNSSGHFNIGLLDLETSEFNIITNTYLDESPSFSPNGEMILYAMNDKGKAKLAIVAIGNSMTKILSTEGGEVRAPSWGPFID